MSLITKVKAGSVSSLSDARYFAGMGVDWLGFDVDTNSDSYVSPELYKSIAGWVAGPKRIIEIKSLSTQDFSDLIQHYSPEGVQLPLGLISMLPSIKLPIFATASLHSIEIREVELIKNKIDYLLLEIGKPSQQDLAKSLLPYSKFVKILLAVTPDLRDVNDLVKNVPIAGLAFLGSKELKTGLKEYDYSELLEQLESE